MNELRAAARQSTDRTGIIEFDGARGAVSIPCTISDVSGTGARLKLDWSLSFPKQATLVFADGLRKTCQVAWQKRRLLGVAFADGVASPDEQARMMTEEEQALHRRHIGAQVKAAREGRGYTEADIREVARALTGYGMDERGRFRFWEGQHDDGEKTIFGQSGRFNADNLPDLILAQPAFGPYIAEQLWRYFISETPDPAQIDNMVARWRDADWDLPTLYRALLETPAFWEPGNHGTLIKSPVELFVGFNRTFGTAPSYLGEIADWSEEAGQALFFPPNVAGWQEGANWINDSASRCARPRCGTLARCGSTMILTPVRHPLRLQQGKPRKGPRPAASAWARSG